MSDLSEFRCPLCGKPLASDEYHHAIGDLKMKVEERYDEQMKGERSQYQQRLEQLEERRKTELDALKKGFDEQLKMLQQTLETSYKTQLDDLKKHYDKTAEESQAQFTLVEEQLKVNQKKELEAKEREIEELEKGRDQSKELAEVEARKQSEIDIKKLKDELSAKDIQISRAKTDIENLQNKLTQSQAELRGEVGERDLYDTMMEAFPEDSFRRQTRGASTGDLTQRISLAPGRYLETPIVYDNKEAETVTKRDLDKAKSYKETHGTNYVLIVSSNLPKEIVNGYLGEKDGVLIIHRSIVVEIARTLRSALIELAKQTESAKDRDVKESRLYDYIKSQDFSRKVDRLLSVYQRLQKLQETEERSHNRLWKDRKSLQLEINQAYTEITNGIASIIQNTPPMHELVMRRENAENMTQEGIEARNERRKDARRY